MRALVDSRLCLLAMTRTGNGLRRWTYYISQQRVALTRLNTAVDSRPSVRLLLDVREEADWASLRTVLSPTSHK